MNSVNANWAGFLSFRPKAISILKVVLLIAILDIVVSVGASFVLSDVYYFERFLADTSVVPEGYYDETVDDYYQHNNYYVKPDQAVGWVNTPNFKRDYEDWDWYTDAVGAVVPSALDSRVEGVNGTNPIFLLGSSVMAGYGVNYESRQTAFLQNKGHNVTDFSSIMYSIDQSYTFYETVLAGYGPSVIVVGIHSEAEALSNMFIPFSPEGTLWNPYLKPAYHLADDGTVSKAQAPLVHQGNKDNAQVLAELKASDSQYYVFQYHKTFSLLPVSNFIGRTLLKFKRKIFYDEQRYAKAVELQKVFMQKFLQLAETNDTEVIFVKFERRDDIEQPFYANLYKDKNTVHSELLKRTSMNVIYVADVFEESGLPVSSLYLDDNLHLSAQGNELLALAVDKKINSLNIK